MRLLAFALMLAVGATLTYGPVPAEVRQAAARISGVRLMRDVDYFAADKLGGRATFSPGLDSAASHIIRRLQAAGLDPLGDSGTFRQYYDVKEATADTSRIVLEAHGKGSGLVTYYCSQSTIPCEQQRRSSTSERDGESRH